MKSYQHLLNAMVGLCAALIGVRLILPAILEIPGFISLLTDETIPQPWEIFKFYLSSGMPLMELSLLAGGILCLLWFAKRRSGAFVQSAAVRCWRFLPPAISSIRPCCSCAGWFGKNISRPARAGPLNPRAFASPFSTSSGFGARQWMPPSIARNDPDRFSL